MSVEVRETNEPVYDGTTGNEIDTVTRYELGAEIDGTWVKFTSLSGDHVKALQERDQQTKKAQGDQQTQQDGDLGAPSQAANAAPHDEVI